MVPGSFSSFIVVHWIRLTVKYANYMVWACPHEEIQMESKRQCYVCVYEL